MAADVVYHPPHSLQIRNFQFIFRFRLRSVFSINKFCPTLFQISVRFSLYNRCQGVLISRWPIRHGGGRGEGGLKSSGRRSGSTTTKRRRVRMGGCNHRAMHAAVRRTIDPRIPATPGLSASIFTDHADNPCTKREIPSMRSAGHMEVCPRMGRGINKAPAVRSGRRWPGG